MFPSDSLTEPLQLPDTDPETQEGKTESLIIHFVKHELFAVSQQTQAVELDTDVAAFDNEWPVIAVPCYICSK